ncbi:MAG TPA: cupredoxin domain-containing protein [Kofleriaceae bacterium]|nr:cupredoxin domain-containing protein [Kofleriaceae bacterium]
MQTEHDATEDVIDQGMVDVVHDQSLLVSEARLSIDAGITKHLGASLVLPVRMVSTDIRYLDASGSEVRLVREGIHHRNETLTGLADPMLLGTYARSLGRVRLAVHAGTTVPLGHTEPDPFAMEDQPHEHIQMGTGTFNPVLSLDAAYAWGAWRVGGFAFTQQTIYESGKGYQAGDRYATGVSLRRGLGAFGVRGGVELQAETAERWNGVIHENEGNQGRLDAMFVAGGSYAVSAQLAFELAVKVPFVTHVQGGQLDMPALVELGASWSIGAPKRAAHVHAEGEEHEHEHEHEHENEHEHADHAAPAAPIDTTGLDIADLGKPGEARDLVPVAGKITIFDFGAAWCEPCKTLEPALVEMVRANPDKLALRRIDVVDWDSAAAARYLTPGGFSLPHVKIFDASGKKRFEKTPAAGQLGSYIEEIRALVAPAAPVTSSTPPARPRTVAKPRVFTIQASGQGFAPSNIVVPRGTPVTLRFERITEKTCATEVVIELHGKKRVQDLPLHKPVDLTLTFDQPGTVTYSCAMNMLRGTITVQ